MFTALKSTTVSRLMYCTPSSVFLNCHHCFISFHQQCIKLSLNFHQFLLLLCLLSQEQVIHLLSSVILADVAEESLVFTDNSFAFTTRSSLFHQWFIWFNQCVRFFYRWFIRFNPCIISFHQRFIRFKQCIIHFRQSSIRFHKYIISFHQWFIRFNQCIHILFWSKNHNVISCFSYWVITVLYNSFAQRQFHQIRQMWTCFSSSLTVFFYTESQSNVLSHVLFVWYSTVLSLKDSTFTLMHWSFSRPVWTSILF